MKITEYTPTPECLYYDHMKRRKNALNQAVLHINESIRFGHHKGMFWEQELARSQSIRAIQTASQHERTAARILTDNPHILQDAAE
jgi:hypothetical protein